MYEQIPEELKNLPQWVGFFREAAKNNKTTKKPVNPKTLYGASSTNPETWGTFEQALSCIGKPCRVGRSKGTVEGVGFVFSPPYCGIDLDNVVIDKETKKLNSFALDIIKNMNSYTEFSPSGTGLHIIYKGNIHNEWKCKRVNALGENTDLEMYQTGRYFTVTGEIFEKNNTIEYRDEIAELIQRAYMIPEEKNTSIKKNEQKYSISLSEDEILTAARNSRNGMEFSELFEGKWNKEKYGSQSEADMAFCLMLAFWFQKDFGKIDAVFRKSGLMRDKWDEMHGRKTYGQMTINKAIEKCTNVFTPSSFNNDDFCINIKSSERKYYSFDDTGNAQRLYNMFSNIIRFNYNDKRWMIYSQNKWIYDISGCIEKLIGEAVEAMKKEMVYYEEYDAKNGTEMKKEFEKHMKKARNYNSKSALEKEIRHYVPVTPNALDSNKMLLNTPEGIINLKTFEITHNTPDAYFTKSTSISYSKDAKCPLWEKFLDDIFAKNEELIKYVQKAAGYSLTGATDEQCAFFLYGTGNNGKSTFIDIIRIIFGDYASNIQPETIMVKNNNSSANSDIARLKGARLVTSVEPNEGVRLNEGLLKQLTGDDIVTARKLYGEEFEFKPEFKLWMATNHRPIIRGTDTGIWRRIHLIPFEVQIPKDKVDKKLKEKLLEETDGIFRWCIDGLKLYQSEGLKKPAVVEQATADYKNEMDTIGKFLDECTIQSFGNYVKASELYHVYTKWCETNGEYKMTNTKFGMEIQKKYEKKRMKYGLVYSGLDFNEDYAPYSISIKE